MLVKPNKPLTIVVLGSPKCGKSAVTVRYLSGRFIGEYSSSKDFLYHQTLNLGNKTTEIEILDTSGCKTNQCVVDHIQWAEAFVIIYSICDLRSFDHAKKLIEKIRAIKNASSLDHNVSDREIITTETNNNFYNDNLYFGDENEEGRLINNNQLPVILLLGNKRDLEHIRQVQVSDVEEFALKFQILFYEISAADTSYGVQLAFQNLIKEAKILMVNQQTTPFCSSLSKENSLRMSMRPYCCGYFENRHLIDYTDNYFKSNSCESASDASLKCSDKYADKFANRRKSSITVKSVFGIMFGSKSSRQKKKRPSLSI